jgi:excisionase family DNA binding protein
MSARRSGSSRPSDKEVPTMPITHNDFLLVEEIAAECRAPKTSVRHWMRTGRLPSIRLGRRRLVRRADFERFLQVAALSPTVGTEASHDGTEQ